MWEETHTKILEALKTELKDNTTLQYFDPQKEIILSVMIDAETRYCNLEHEMLAVAWAVNHKIKNQSIIKIERHLEK